MFLSHTGETPVWESWDSNNYDYNKDGEGSIVLAAGRPRPQGLSGSSPASVCVYTLSQSAPRRGGVRGSRRATSPPQGRGLILDPCTRLLASSTPTSTEPWRQNVARQIDSYSCGLVQSDVDVHPSVLSVLQAVASASALPKELSAWQAEARCQGKQEQDARAKQDVLVNVLVAPSSGLLALSAEHRAPSSSELQHRGAGGALLFR